MSGKPDTIADRPAAVEILERSPIGNGFLPYERFEIVLKGSDAPRKPQQRDVLRGGAVAAVLPIDLARDEIVLIRQFRLAAHLATGHGEMVEIVAGRVDENEAAIEAAARECFEEIGLRASKLVELYTVVPSPGVCDERVTFFLGSVDTSKLPSSGGTDPTEQTRPFAVPIDAAIVALPANRIQNALAVSALQWMALNRRELVSLLEGA
jgi:ADP-ribose pyrophosphatase